MRTSPDPLPGLPAAVEVAAYRVAREALTNVVRHARATLCTVCLEVADARLSVTVVDDGVGLGQPTRAGVGLASMRERAEELGGTFEAVPATANGTRVHAKFPVGARHG